MEYTSRLGTITYYDNILYKSSICEPSLLFILGLERIISDKDDIYTIKINKLLTDGTTLDVFDNITNYIYNNAIYLLDYIEFYCGGLKSLIYKLSNEYNTVPIIFHDYRDTVNKQDNETDIEFIENIFKFAGYHLNSNQIKLVSHIDDDSEFSSVGEYNAHIKADHHKKLLYSKIYKSLDYKSMYSYSLGVLYGCTCIGYNTDDVFHTDPIEWYTCENIEFIRSAWFVFKFHHIDRTRFVDNDCRLFNKYKGIQQNRIWNFTS